MRRFFRNTFNPLLRQGLQVDKESAYTKPINLIRDNLSDQWYGSSQAFEELDANKISRTGPSQTMSAIIHRSLKEASSALLRTSKNVSDYIYDDLNIVDDDPFANNMRDVMRYIDHGAKQNSIILGSSNPILPIHEKVAEAAAEAVYRSEDIYDGFRAPQHRDSNMLRYYSSRSARGIEELKKSVTNFCKQNGFNTENLDYFFTNSIQGSILPKLCDGTMEAGDKVLMTSPTYGPFYSLFHEKRINIVTEKLSESTNWKLTPEVLSYMLEENPTAKLFILVNPGNPMGEVYSKDELEKLSQVFIKHNKGRSNEEKLIVFCDEVAKNAVLSRKEKFTSLGSIEGMEDFTYTGWSLSKDQSPGLGVAIGVGPSWLIKKVRSNDAGPPFPMQVAATATFLNENQEDLEAYYEESREIYRRNIGLVFSLMQEINSDLNKKFFPDEEDLKSLITCEIAPEGGFQLAFNAKGLYGMKLPEDYENINNPQKRHIESSLDLAYYLRDSALVEFIPGEGFGFDGEDMKFRMTISKRPEQIEKAFLRVKESLSELSIDHSLKKKPVKDLLDTAFDKIERSFVKFIDFPYKPKEINATLPFEEATEKTNSSSKPLDSANIKKETNCDGPQIEEATEKPNSSSKPLDSANIKKETKCDSLQIS